MSKSPEVFLAADEKTLVQLIEGARRRLVVLAPALTRVVAEAVRSRWRALGPSNVSVTLDIDPEVYRLGYGDPEALPLLEETGRAVGDMLNRQPGIRIGVVISDASVLIFSPIPALIEAGPRDASHPNGILLTGPAPELEEALGAGADGVLSREVGLDKATLDDIDALQKDLQLNPPQRFDVARAVRVFNVAFQFVELSIRGTQVQRRRAKIPSHLLGVGDPQLKRELTALLHVVPEGHGLSGERLERQRRRLEKRYFKVIRGHGHAILRAKKDEFLKEFKVFEAEVADFKDMIDKKIGDELEKRIDSLVDTLLPRLQEDPPPDWMLPYADLPARQERIRHYLREDLEDALGRGSGYARGMSVKLVFRDVTYESLGDPEFVAAATEAFPELKGLLHHEQDAAPAL